MKRIFFRLILIFGVIFLVFQIFYGKTGLLRQFQLSNQNKELQVKIDSLKVVLEKKNAEIKLLHSDSAYLEHMARTRLGMSKDDEKVFQFINEDKLK
jgi:cell division protein FtsB